MAGRSYRLLEQEKQHARLGDELARQRRELPWVRLEMEDSFETEDGTNTLADLFDGRSQLLVHHFMFGPKYTAGCPICSSAADTIVIHLNQRDVRLVRVSRAPLEKLLADKQRIGWPFPWVRSLRSDFDFDVSATEEQQQPLLERGNL